MSQRRQIMAKSIVTQSEPDGLPSQLQRSWQKAFRERMADVPREQWRCVGIDIGKYEHVAVIQDGNGAMLSKPLRFGISKTQVQRLWDLVDASQAGSSLKPLFAMEPTGHYYEPMAQMVRRSYGAEQVYLIQARDVARRRTEWNQGGFKNDEVDACVIAQLLRQGDGRPYRPAQGVYQELYHLERYRWVLEQASTRLKNQIIGHVDRLYPGLVIQNKKMAQRYPALFASLWRAETPRRLMMLFPNPYLLRRQTKETLFQAFRAQHYWMTQPYAEKILSAVRDLCLPDNGLASIRSSLLQQDLERLEQIEQRTAYTEMLMTDHLDATWGRWLRSTEVDSVRLACLVATIGDIHDYHSARQLFGRSGLHSRCSDSGTRQRRGQGERMVKAGDRHLRRQLLRFTRCMIARYPSLRSYEAQLRQRGKNFVTAQIAVARKLTAMIYAVGTQETPFDPAFLA
jgi:transposase